jgi:hypothetical protein
VSHSYQKPLVISDQHGMIQNIKKEIDVRELEDAYKTEDIALQIGDEASMLLFKEIIKKKKKWWFKYLWMRIQHMLKTAKRRLTSQVKSMWTNIKGKDSKIREVKNK